MTTIGESKKTIVADEQIVELYLYTGKLKKSSRI